MFDRELALDDLRSIRKVIVLVMERAAFVAEADDFLRTPDGVLRLDALCMNLIALGELVKGLDKATGGRLLPEYTEVYWPGVARMRDKIAHHYFEVDPDVVFQTVKKDIPVILPVVERMIKELEVK